VNHHKHGRPRLFYSPAPGLNAPLGTVSLHIE
jgi:hypothetical protein